MPQHSRRPPAPPAPEFYIADPPPPPRAARADDDSPQILADERGSDGPTRVDPRESAASTRRAPSAESREPSARGWHQSESWAIVMLVSFAIMLVAIYVPGRIKLALIGLSVLTAIAGVVMLGRRGLFDPPQDD